MKYTTVKRFYPILVKWYNIGVDIDNWFWDHRKNKFIWYVDDFFRNFRYHGIKGSSFYYWEIRPRIYKLIKLYLTITGSITGMKYRRRLENDWDTKLIDSNPGFCYTRNRGWINRYYTCIVYPFNFVRLLRTTYNTKDKECINTYTTMVFSMLGSEEEPEEIIPNTITLYKGFIWNKKQLKKALKAYKMDLDEINKIMDKAREEDRKKREELKEQEIA